MKGGSEAADRAIASAIEDHMDHMNVQFYTARFDEATWHLFAALGMTTSYFKENRRGMAALEQRTLYKRELHAGALIRISSELLEAKPKTIRFRHRMYDAESGEEVATSELVGAHIDTGARKAVAFPDEIARRQHSLIAAFAASA
jgi:acyl-CoA thioester hydrolase